MSRHYGTASSTGSSEKPANLLTVQEAISETIHRSYGPNGQHIPVKAIAQDANVPLCTLYDIADEHRERKLRAEEIPALVRATGNHLILDVLARAAGGAFVPLPPVLGSLGDDYRHASDALAQFGETMQAYASALADGRITEDEHHRIDQEGHEAITAILSLIAHSADKVCGGVRKARV